MFAILGNTIHDKSEFGYLVAEEKKAMAAFLYLL
jgi:hypothetical protein